MTKFPTGIVWLLAVLLLAIGSSGAAPAAEQAAPVAGAEPAPADPPFDVWEYRIRGNTLLPTRDLEKVVYPLLGPGRRLADVEQARVAVEQAYRDAGFATVYVDIPEQEVDGGVVRLQVTEGRVASLRITGSRYFSNGWIRDQVPEVEPGNVPRLAVFQQQLRQVGTRSADRLVTPVLRPGRAPGTVDVELKVQDRLPVNGSIEVNNRNVPNTTSSRVSASVRYDNLWQRDHSLGFQYNVAPEEPDETSVLAASYVFRPKGSALSYAFYGVKSDSEIAVAVSDLNVIGQGTIIGGRMVVPLPSAAAFVQGLSVGLDYKDFDEAIRFGGDPDDPDDLITPVSYVNWSATWNGAWFGERQSQGLEFGLNFGLRNFENDTPEFEDRRFKGRANYVYVTAGYDLTRQLPWGTSAYVSLNGQITPQPLVPNEQFNAGGLDTVRGYFESELLGDYGLQAQLEWRSPNVGPRLGAVVDGLYGYTFVDWATLRILEAQASQIDSYTVYSAGLGLRTRIAAFTASLDWAWPFRDGTATDADDDRLLALLRLDF
jgi:hemolysin activation/secretion protein